MTDGFIGRPAPPPGARNLVFVTLDSCRYDTFAEARTPVLSGLGIAECRYSYASWTAPAHYNLLLGLLPHCNPQGTYAGKAYIEEFRGHERRLGFPLMTPNRAMDSFYFPTFLQDAGYFTGALVSLSALSPASPINRGFDRFRQMSRHNDMRAMLSELWFPADRPAFWLLNVGETHYPYALPNEDPAHWPKLTGAHGVFRHFSAGTSASVPRFFDLDQMAELRARQVRAVEYLDGVFGELFAILPSNTWICIMGDHGELFGEDGFFGHGPIQHPKVLEVPFLEGLIGG